MPRMMKKALSAVAVFALTVLGFTMPAMAAPFDSKIEVRYPNLTPNPIERIELTIYDPANPAEKQAWVPGNYESRKIPAGWLLNATIELAPNHVARMGDPNLKISDFDETVTGTGKDAQITYTLEGWDPTARNIWMSGWQFGTFNYASYNLNGGSWAGDEDGFTTAEPGLRANQKFITPHGTVYKPKDPVREGHTFVGWSGSSKLDTDANKNNSPRTFTRENPYDFTEVDPNNMTGFTRGGLVSLKAEWVKLPTLEVKDVEIFEGEEFTPEDLVASALDADNKDLLDPANGGKVTYEGDYDATKAGTYPITVTVTDQWGGEVTKTANLVVKKKLTPIVPAPTLEVKDVEIFEGDDFDPQSMVVSANGGDAVVDPNAQFDKDTAGTYPITFTVTNEIGAKITKTANLVVKKKLTPIVPAPALEVKDMEITEGDDFDPMSMVVSSSGDAVVDPESTFDPNTPGTYSITFTVTDENGAKITKTATLTVKEKPAPEPPTPGDGDGDDDSPNPPAPGDGDDDDSPNPPAPGDGDDDSSKPAPGDGSDDDDSAKPGSGNGQDSSSPSSGDSQNKQSSKSGSKSKNGSSSNYRRKGMYGKVQLARTGVNGQAAATMAAFAGALMVGGIALRASRGARRSR